MGSRTATQSERASSVRAHHDTHTSSKTQNLQFDVCLDGEGVAAASARRGLDLEELLPVQNEFAL